MKRITIYGGSFNPIHCGHTALAETLVKSGVTDEVWLMVSPRNPLKEQAELADEHWRFRLAELAVEGIDGVKASDFEFSLPRPSYTYATLSALQTAYPDVTFSLLIGADNWQVFPQWAHHETLVSEHDIFIYPRPDFPIREEDLPVHVHLLHDVPLFDCSSTDIRNGLRQGADMTKFIPASALPFFLETQPYGPLP